MKFMNPDELESTNIDEGIEEKKAKKKLSYDDRAIINSEIICYPITNISRPLDMFGPFPKTVKSFVPVAPPPPPNRKSSRTNSTLKLVTHYNTTPTRSKSCSKHDSLNNKVSSAAKKVDLNRSRSAGPALINSITASTRKEDIRTRRISYRANSTSPVARRIVPDRKKSQSPIAFGRGISKERAFAVEKKKIDEELAKISKNLHVSTRILRNPELRSPNEVKKALHNTFKPITFSKDPRLASLMMKKSLERQAICQASSKSEQKSLKVTVAISSRGREILRTSSEMPQRGLRQTSNASTLSSSRSTTTKSIPSSKFKIKSKPSTATGSNISLNRTNSTFSINSEDTLKHKQKPQTITSKNTKKTSPKKEAITKSGEKNLFQDSFVENNHKTVESINEAIVHQNEAIRSDAFFQKLFLRNETCRHGISTSPTASVVEKTRMWNALTACKSEPSLRVQHYLRQSRPVSRSKFHEVQTQNESFKLFHNNQNFDEAELSRSGFVTEQIYKYDSLFQLSDEDEFGNSNRGRSLDFTYSSYHHERSNSEPPNNKTVTELVRSNSPIVIYGHNKSSDSEKRHRSSRSPSCRRIQNLKANKLIELSTYQKELVRAQSVGRTDRAKEKLSNLHRSKSLNVLNYEKHMPFCGHRKNERFRDLSEFYTCLERIGQLECATSNSDLRPRRRNEEIIDYDLWQKVREYEKNERELNILIRKLRAEQRDKGFLFQPHSPEEIRWTPESDLGLITKEKSVENLKEIFYSKLDEIEVGEYQKVNGTRDNYKPLWRASSVLDLASNMTQKYNKPKTSSTLPRSDKNLGLSKKLLSTLSKDQLNKIKNQLSEIYSGNETTSQDNLESFVVTVPAKKSPSENSDKSEKSFLTVRSHSELGKNQIQEPTIDVSTLKNVFEEKEKTSKAASEISESEKRSISQTLSQEAKEKFAKKKVPTSATISSVDNSNNSNKTPQKPKRDISFTFKEAPPSAEKYLVDCIPSRKKQQEPQKVATETESISSETSNKTVIYRKAAPIPVEDVQKKIKYFEEIERDKEKVETTIYHAAEDSSLDEEEAEKKGEEKNFPVVQEVQVLIQRDITKA
jgi:sorbin and SH3 domain containing protein 1